MNSIPIVNRQLVQILNNFKDEILSNDLSKLNFRQRNATKDNHYFCSIDLLNDLKNQETIDRTKNAKLVNIDSTFLKEINSKLDADLDEWDEQKGYAVPKSSIRRKMFDQKVLGVIYPASGYMSWHTNSDDFGHNVLLTWSENGNGFFRYQDPITKEIVTMQDKPGWNCKVGYFGKHTEPDKLFWHCCSTDELRISLAWIFPTAEVASSFENKTQQS
jgi:hypothetical protein